ncbi:hypothetical protein N7474_002051 [Penicillium riverlandense]|uniref:uncharacterized protein n=1 Tax=Penicillium riverlandense TaxID=1903569 RepID=UPI002546C325|nr:uncharacterized protein N7474_002051 [Penicillium riverlandense]KAJ5833740.1 hypothetical protein N7474_002051 [Penicillium riverlandense]
MSGIHRFLARRDRHSRHEKHGKDESSHILSKPLFQGFFTSEVVPENGPEHKKKVKELERRIREIGIVGLREENCSYALLSTQGDLDRAFLSLILLEDSIEGIIRPYSPTTKLLGAENREGVTCWLDSLLFAMFVRLDCFEAVLYKQFPEEPRNKLAVLIRYWVNMLRSGQLITTDITKHLQNTLAECGWASAGEVRQQDVSEAFTFITGKLELPLLTLMMSIYHWGKTDLSSDHKFINERLLEVAIPPERADGQTLTLEDCLEAYFNNRIEVKRYLEENRESLLSSTESTESLTKGSSAHVEEITGTLTPTASNTSQSFRASPASSTTGIDATGTATRTLPRRDSIVRERFIPDPTDEKADAKSDGSQPRKGSYRKEVMMPAWQFFSLIRVSSPEMVRDLVTDISFSAWYTDNTPTNDAQVADHFSSQRPILGICLKRYSYLPNGRAIRLNTFIDIPTEIGLPCFIKDDKLDDKDTRLYGNFKLSLQSMVCHRGNSVDSGHYISIVRGTTADSYPLGVEPGRFWIRFDDLAAERVTLVDIEEAMKTESPYLLFYQILPIGEDASTSYFQNRHYAPSSQASEDAMVHENLAGVSASLLALSDNDKTNTDDHNEEPASGRPSLEVTAPNNGKNTDDHHTEEPTSGRPSLEVPAPGSPTAQLARNPERRSGVVFSDRTSPRQARSMPSTSPRMAPTTEEEGNKFSFSRRGSRSATKSQSGSRATSQSGDKRLSATFSRFAGRLSREKMSSDGSAADSEVDDWVLDSDEAMPGDMKLGLAAHSDGRTHSKDYDRFKEKKEKGKEKKLERECLVM